MRGEAARALEVAVVDEELPYPPVSGKRLRTFHLLSRLARRHRLTYLCQRNEDEPEARRAEKALRDCGIEVVCVPRSVPAKSGPGFYARLAANLFSPLPYSVASHRSPALRAAVRAHASRRVVDLWQAEWTPYMEALCELGDARRVVVAHNVESVIWRRYAEAESNPLKRWYVARQWRKFRRYEASAFARADRVVAVSPADAERVARDFGCPCVSVVDNGVDVEYFQPAEQPGDPRRILFLGSLDWRPNLDAVARLLDEVFPAIRRAQPAARLVVVGRRPPAWLTSRAGDASGVEVHADVPDVRPFLASCGVMAVPLRVGGGSRLKILEALAAGVPVVSTRVGAEGLALTPGRHLDVVETATEVAGALLAVMRDPAPARARAAAGRVVVLERYGWDRLADALERVWLEVASAPRSR